MKINILERHILLQLLPKQSDLKTLIVVRSLNDKFKIEQKELDAVIMKDNKNIDIELLEKTEKNYEFTDIEKNILQEELNRISNEKKLPIELVNFMQTINNS